ncbi:hypothetical protein DFS34DRAFT_214842 [Phlyctochytrium arcticum]|nr:hypothetical protein DFS34DRAFT_214842 [Phlyctochytrium arcticum]
MSERVLFCDVLSNSPMPPQGAQEASSHSGEQHRDQEQESSVGAVATFESRAEVSSSGSVLQPAPSFSSGQLNDGSNSFRYSSVASFVSGSSSTALLQPHQPSETGPDSEPPVTVVVPTPTITVPRISIPTPSNESSGSAPFPNDSINDKNNSNSTSSNNKGKQPGTSATATTFPFSLHERPTIEQDYVRDVFGALQEEENLRMQNNQTRWPSMDGRFHPSDHAAAAAENGELEGSPTPSATPNTVSPTSPSVHQTIALLPSSHARRSGRGTRRNLGGNVTGNAPMTLPSPVLRTSLEAALESANNSGQLPPPPRYTPGEEQHRKLFVEYRTRLRKTYMFPVFTWVPSFGLILYYAIAANSQKLYTWIAVVLWLGLLIGTYVAYRLKFHRLKQVNSLGLLPSLPEEELNDIVMNGAPLRPAPEYDDMMLRWDEPLPMYTNREGVVPDNRSMRSVRSRPGSIRSIRTSRSVGGPSALLTRLWTGGGTLVSRERRAEMANVEMDEIMVESPTRPTVPLRAMTAPAHPGLPLERVEQTNPRATHTAPNGQPIEELEETILALDSPRAPPRRESFTGSELVLREAWGEINDAQQQQVAQAAKVAISTPQTTPVTIPAALSPVTEASETSSTLPRTLPKPNTPTPPMYPTIPDIVPHSPLSPLPTLSSV